MDLMRDGCVRDWILICKFMIIDDWDVHVVSYVLVDVIPNAMVINPCPAELLQLYFSSFEAGIANAISSSKWWKMLLFLKNRHV